MSLLIISGNEAIHRLTFGGYHILHVEVLADDIWYFGQYSWFDVASEANGFQVQFNNFTGNICKWTILPIHNYYSHCYLPVAIFYCCINAKTESRGIIYTCVTWNINVLIIHIKHIFLTVSGLIKNVYFFILKILVKENESLKQIVLFRINWFIISKWKTNFTVSELFENNQKSVHSIVPFNFNPLYNLWVLLRI